VAIVKPKMKQMKKKKKTTIKKERCEACNKRVATLVCESEQHLICENCGCVDEECPLCYPSYLDILI
jgi:uncharacterized protein (DUF779 family)